MTEETHTDTACRKCVRGLQKVDNTVTTFKQSYQCTLGKLRETHGCDSISFKRQFAEEETSASRKVLFADDRDENVPDIEGNNFVKVRFCKHSKIIILLSFHSLFFFSLCFFFFFKYMFGFLVFFLNFLLKRYYFPFLHNNPAK